MLEDIVLNLTIIGKIHKGGRIKTDYRGKITLENENLLQPLTRWALNFHREQAVNDIKQIKTEAFDKADDIMDNKFFNIFKLKENPTESEIEAHNKRVDQLNELTQSLFNSTKGIENLKETYNQDATIASRLDIMISEINNKVTEIKSKLDIVHFNFIKTRRKSIDTKRNVSFEDNNEEYESD